MSKFKAIIIPNNTKAFLEETEVAIRSKLPNIIEDCTKNQIKIHSFISTQYVSQFSIQTLVKPNNLFQEKTFLKTKRYIFNHTIRHLDLINDPAKIFAKTAAKLVFAQSVENVYSRILLLDQFTSLREMDDSKIIEFYPKMSVWLNKAIVDCKNNIKKTKFSTDDKQMGLYSDNTNDASIDDEKTTLRNTTIKK